MTDGDRVARDLIITRDSCAPLAARIAAGARLWDLCGQADLALAPLKVLLREQARVSLNAQPGSHTFEGDGMTRAIVTVPKPMFKLIAGTDIPALKLALGASFDHLFEEVTTYKVRQTALTKVASMGASPRELVLSVLVQDEPTPRVALRSAGHGIEQI